MMINDGINLKQSNKLYNDDMMMQQHFEDMSTLPQTFDPKDMNFNMDIEEIDASLDLRRR
jgi:hypothetical protein